MVEGYAIKLITEDKFFGLKDQMLSYLETNRKERILRFKFQVDAQRSILGDIMVRSIISQKLNLTNKQIVFNISEKGKPSLAGNTGLFFNVSHAGNWVVAAFSDHEVGIDVELIKKVKYNIAELFFSNEENLSLNKLSGQKKLEYFFDLWTMKESYLKYTGKGLSEPLNSFTIAKTGSNFILSHPSKEEEVYLQQYKLDNGYKLAVCSAVDDFIENLSIVNVEERLNWIT